MIYAIFPISFDSPLCLHFFQILKYNSLGNKDYSTKLFSVIITVNVNADEDRGIVRVLVESRNKALAGAMDEFPETIPV